MFVFLQNRAHAHLHIIHSKQSKNSNSGKCWAHVLCGWKPLCTYYAVLCLSVCWTGKQSERLQCDAGAEITLPSRMKSRLVWRTLVDLLTCARGESCKFFGGRKVKEITFFGWKLRGLQIIFWVRNFEVSVWPRSLRAAFDCTTVFLCNSVLII